MNPPIWLAILQIIVFEFIMLMIMFKSYKKGKKCTDNSLLVVSFSVFTILYEINKDYVTKEDLSLLITIWMISFVFFYLVNYYFIVKSSETKEGYLNSIGSISSSNSNQEIVSKIFGPYVNIALPIMTIGMVMFFATFLLDITHKLAMGISGIILLSCGSMLLLVSMKRQKKT